MGSNKSLRYEVLVRPKSAKEQQSTFSPFLTDDDSSSAPTALFETKVQRFACDRENMQQYWIPEGYHPVLIPRAYLSDSLVAASNNNNSGHSMNNTGNTGNAIIHQSRRINNDINDIEIRRRRNFNNPTPINGGISRRRRRNNNINVNSNNRRTILGQSSPVVNMNTIVNRQRIKERISAIRNSAVTISPSSILKNNNNLSDCSPSAIIGEMWKVENEKVKKHYERLAIRKKISQALAFEQKFSSPSFSGKSVMNNVHIRNTTPSSRYCHVNPATSGSSCRSVPNNAVEGVESLNFDVYCYQNVDSLPYSSPINKNRPIPDWMTRSDAEDFYDENDENNSDVDLDADSTVTTIA